MRIGILKVWGTGGREFKSLRSDQLNQRLTNYRFSLRHRLGTSIGARAHAHQCASGRPHAQPYAGKFKICATQFHTQLNSETQTSAPHIGRTSTQSSCSDCQRSLRNFDDHSSSAAYWGAPDLKYPSRDLPFRPQCMVRPCVARSFVDLVFGLASMYPASDWSGLLLRATMDISARSISLADRPRWAKRVTSVRSRREDRSPSLRYLSQTSAGKALSASLLHHRRLLISSVPWFVLMAVPSSRPAPSTCDARRRGQGRPARAARRAWP